jgi:hypothetical protein
MGHRRWLRHRHPRRFLWFNNAFDGKPKEKGGPLMVMGSEVIIRSMEYQGWIGARNRLGSTNDPSKVHGVKQHSILYDFPYFKLQIMLIILLKTFSRIVPMLQHNWLLVLIGLQSITQVAQQFFLQLVILVATWSWKCHDNSKTIVQS